jgi:hypothetical protein
MGKNAALLLILIFLTVPYIIAVTQAVPYVNAQTDIAPSAYISLNAETVELGQGVSVEMWIEPAPPTPTDRIHGTLKVMRPDGITDSFDPPIYSQNGTLVWSYMPNQVGNFSFQFIYPGDSFANGTITYRSALSPVITLTVPGTPRPRIETPGGA